MEHEHDLDGLALLIIGRRHEEREVEAEPKKQEGEAREPRDDAVGDAEKTRRIGRLHMGLV